METSNEFFFWFNKPNLFFFFLDYFHFIALKLTCLFFASQRVFFSTLSHTCKICPTNSITISLFFQQYHYFTISFFLLLNVVSVSHHFHIYIYIYIVNRGVGTTTAMPQVHITRSILDQKHLNTQTPTMSLGIY